MYEKLRASVAGSPVVKFGDYPYVVHPLTDGLPSVEPEVLQEAVDGLATLADWRFVDRIITAEAMGFPLAAALSLKVRKPYLFIRKRRYGLPSELSLKQVTGYSGTDLFFNFVRPGERLAFVDDIVSTGGTLRAVAKAIRSLDAKLQEVLVVFDKMADGTSLEKELGLKVKALLKIAVVDGKAIVKGS